MKCVIFSFVISLLAVIASAQTQVANYAAGTAGREDYESLSFWIENEKPSNIFYTYGKDQKEQILLIDVNNSKTLTLILPDKGRLYVVALGNALQVKHEGEKYNKTFNWEYKGPVEGLGTYCEVCMQNETEAMGFMQQYYLR